MYSSGFRRTTKYTEDGLRRMLCAKCRIRKAVEQWALTPCAANITAARWIPVCLECDLDLNRDALFLLGYHPQDIYAMMSEYGAKKFKEHHGTSNRST